MFCSTYIYPFKSASSDVSHRKATCHAGFSKLYLNEEVKLLLFISTISCHKITIPNCNFSTVDVKDSSKKIEVIIYLSEFYTFVSTDLQWRAFESTCNMHMPANSLRPAWLQWMSNELIIMETLSVTITFTVCYCFYTYEPWG